MFVGLWILLCLYTIAVTACQLPFGPTPSALDGQNAAGNKPASLTVDAPQQIAAGTPLTVTIRTPAVVDSNSVQLYLYNTNGTRLFTAMVEGGQATIAIPTTETEVAGEVTLFAQNGTRTGHATVSIVPGPPIEPVLLLVGPRSVTADGDHWTMVTALPHDHYGNAVAEGTTVTVRALHPASTTEQPAGNNYTLDDEIEVLTTATNHLLAWERVFARTVAGRMDIAAGAGAAHSPERTVLAVPGPPRPFALRSEPLQRTADGRRLATIYTEPLQDRFGNQLLDGTAVTFLVADSDGTIRSLPTQSIDGKASIQLQSPAIPGTLQIVALVLNTTSEPFALDFTAGLGIRTIEVRAIPTDDLLTLIAGPLLGPLKQYIPDGSDVYFTLTPVEEEGSADQAATIDVTAQAAAGFATTVIRNSLLTASRYEVIVRAGTGEGRTNVILGSE